MGTVEGEASTFEHWDVTGIRPADLTNEIPKGASRSEGAAAAPIAGATERALDGITGWASPCPPQGTGEHRYQFTFTALNAAGAEVIKHSTMCSSGTKIACHEGLIESK